MSPTVDPFYAAPAALASYPPGAILRSRQVDVQLGPAPLTALAAKAYQLLYRTNDARGVPVANVTTIIVPNDPPPGGGRQLISVNDAEDSVDPNCAPSYQLQTGEQSNGNLAVETSLASAQLGLGRDLVVPDAEGPKSEYIVTGMEGHATLDSIRAVERFPPAQLHGAATPVGLIGYSGGAHVTAAASELQPRYAPELDIVGIAAGGVPVGNRETVDYLDGSVGAGVLMATSIALDRAFPELDLYSYLNAKGKAFAQQVSTGCASSVFAAPFAHFSDWTTVPHVFDSAVVARVIADNALGHATPTAPTFFYNGVHDELITIKALDKLVAYYCDNGARIDYFRDPAGLEHIQGVADFYPLALSYLADRFNGDDVPNSCGPAGSHAATGGSQASGRTPARACVSARVVVVRARIPSGVSVRRIIVSVAGRIIKVANRSRALHISLAGRPNGSVSVEVRIIGRLHRRAVTLRQRHVYRTCQRSKRS
jgi:Secretory lipase